MPNLFVSDSNLLRPVRTMDDLTPYEREAITPNLLSNSDVVVAEPDDSADSDSVLVATPVSNSAGYIPLVSAKPYVDPSAAKELSYSQADVGDLPPLDMNAPMGQEPLPETNDPWYGRIAGTIKNILNLGKERASDYGSKVGDFVEKNPTALQDWANQYASSPFLAMARNEHFDRMRAQANANLDREAKMGRAGSEAAPVQIYKHFLGELDSTRPDLTVAEKQKIAYEKMVESLHASRSNITIGGEANDKWVNDINKKTYEDINNAANDSYFLGAAADELVGALERGDLTTGGGDIGSWGLGTLNKLGLSSGKQQQYSALLSRFSMEQRKALLSSFKGSISDKEQGIIASAIASLGSSRAENLVFLKLASLSARLAQASREKYDELMGMGLTGFALSKAYNDYLKKRADEFTSKEVASIMGGIRKESGGESTGGEGRLLNYR